MNHDSYTGKYNFERLVKPSGPSEATFLCIPTS